MGNGTFIRLCKEMVAEYYNEHTDDDYKITEENVYVVTMGRIRKNNAALLRVYTTDGIQYYEHEDMYYECLWDGENDCLILNAYRKCEN